MIIIEGKKNCNCFAIDFLATIAIAQLSIDLPGTIAIDKEFTTNAKHTSYILKEIISTVFCLYRIPIFRICKIVYADTLTCKKRVMRISNKKHPVRKAK